MAASTCSGVRRGLAVCVGTTGPGATNALTGIASAQADSLPVLLLTGQVVARERVRQGRDSERARCIRRQIWSRLFQPVTKLSAMFPSVDRIPDLLRSAIRTATTGRQGAVHLNMPANMLRCRALYPRWPCAPRHVGSRRSSTWPGLPRRRSC